MKDSNIFFYSDEEEKLNVISHAMGFVASIIGTYLLVSKSLDTVPTKHLICLVVYGFSLITLFGASTLYHSATNADLRKKLNIVDHAAIYLLIAGTYTPFTIISLEGATGWYVFVAIWIFAFIGMILKLFFTGQYQKLSTSMYVVMGWMVLFVINPLIVALPVKALVLLFLGGVLYSVGALIFSFDKVKFNHAIFHLFVLGGSLSHFLAIYLYV